MSTNHSNLSVLASDFHPLVKRELEQGSANVFSQVPPVNIVGLLGHTVCHNYKTLSLSLKGNHRQDVNEWTWLFSNKTAFMDTKINST